MDNNVLVVNKDDIVIAQNLCSSISDNDTRNRAVANVMAVELGARFFDSYSYKVDTKSGLHNIPKVLENIDIADIYINGAYIDVRIYFSADEICIPKSQIDMGIKPIAYMFIKLEQDLSSYKVTGFIRPEYIDSNNIKDNFYYLNEKDLVAFSEIESILTETDDTFNGSKELLYDFVDGSIDENNIIKLINILTTSANARNILIKAFKAQSVFKFVSVQDTTIENNVIEESNDHSEINPNKDTDNTDMNLDSFFVETEESIGDEDNLYNALEYSTEVTPSEPDAVDTTDNEEQIDELFTDTQKTVPTGKKKISSTFIILLLILILSSVGAYFILANRTIQNEDSVFNDNSLPAINNEESVPTKDEKSNIDAMPNETVNTSYENPQAKEQGSSIAIPAIEQNLDASVLVSNLKVSWEVPSGYASNTAAKRYLVKLGKIIQLNLKSELLLLSKPPIANKISVELHYNPIIGKFDIVGIKESSGEKSVDDVIMKTIKKALDLSVSSNSESFGKLQGNPILIIRL